MAKQFLSDDVIQHIQDGYYATHEQDLSEEQVRALTEEQLNYYNKQGRDYRIAQSKKKKITISLLGLAVIVVVAVVVFLMVSMNSDKGLYDPNNKTETTDTSNDTPGLVPAEQSNTRAGAKDSAAQ